MHQYLAQEVFSAARSRVRKQLVDRPYESWDPDDRAAANNVCASYDQAGLLLSAGILRRDTRHLFLGSSWGESICDQYETLHEFLADKQTPTRTGIEFFKHFAALYSEAAVYHRHDVGVKTNGN
jgi:hypothetical protein